MTTQAITRKPGLAWLLVLAISLLTLPALAQPGPGGPGGGPGGRGGRGPMAQKFRKAMMEGRLGHLSAKLLLLPNVKQQLGLTPDQVSRIEKIDYDAEKAQIEQDAKIKGAQLDLRQLVKADNPDRDKIMAQIDTVGTLRTERHKLDAGRMLDIRAVLTPDQVAKAKQLIEERREQWRERAAEGRGPWRERAAERRTERQGTRPEPAATPATPQ